MPKPDGSPVILHLDLGVDFLLGMLDKFGVRGWNGWQKAMYAIVPDGWGEGEAEPPLKLWQSFQGADLSGRTLDGIDLALAWCKDARFDNSSMVGARLGCCEGASFRNCDLRQADIGGDMTGADFTGARLDDACFDDMTFNADRPPVGLTAEMTHICRARPRVIYGECQGGGGYGPVEHPVKITASLMESSTCG